MIFRSVCVCAFLLLCWSLITGLLVGDSGWELPLREQNNVLAQDYIYAPASGPKTVVAGTSLTARLPLTHLGRDSIYRLSFGGASVADALTIIEQVEPLPGRLLLETNLLVKAEDENFTAPLLHPVGVRVRQYVPAMRTRNRPISLLMAGLFYLKTENSRLRHPPKKNGPSTRLCWTAGAQSTQRHMTTNNLQNNY